MADQLQFSFRLDPEEVPIGQEIFFVVTLTNTTDLPIVFREPKQSGVHERESYDKTLLFSVEPISGELEIAYLVIWGLFTCFQKKYNVICL